MTDPNMPAFLEHSHREGTLESESEFSLNRSGALAKLGRFQLEKEEFWLLKMVQFANLIQAEAVDIKVARHSTTVLIEGTNLQARELYHQAVSQPASLHPMSVALRCLAALDGVSFELKTHNPDDIVRHPDRARLSEQKLAVEPALLLTVERPSKLSFRHLQSVIRRRRDEQEALSEFCWTSSVPIRVDGRLLKAKLCTEGHLKKPPKPGHPVIPISLIRGFVPAFEGRPILHMSKPDLAEFQALPDAGPWDIFLRREWFKDEEKVYCQLPHDTPCGAHVNFLACGALQVHFLCLGVLIDGIEIPHQVPKYSVGSYRQGFQLILPVEQKETDLGGFRVRDRENLALQGFSSAVPHAFQLCDFYRKLGPNFKLPSVCYRQSWRNAERVGSLGVGLVVTLGTGAATGGVLPTLGGLVASASLGSQIPNYFRWHLNTLFSPMIKILSPFREALLHTEAKLLERGVSAWTGPGPAPEVDPHGWESWEGERPPAGDRWAPNLVQASVVWGCDSVEFSFSRKEAQVRWSGAPALTSEALFGKGPAPLEPGLEHLRTSLVCLRHHLITEIELRLSDGLLTWKSSGFELTKMDSPTEMFLKVKLANPYSPNPLRRIWRKYLGPKRFRVDAISQLQETAWLAPIPVRVDGRLLEPGYGRIPKGVRETFQEGIHRRLPLCLARCELARDVGRSILPRPYINRENPPGDTWAQETLTLPAIDFDRSLPSGEDLGAILSLTGGLRSESAVEFVHHGVLVDRQALFHPDDFSPVEEMKPGLPGRGQYGRLCLRLYVPVESHQLEPDGRVKDRWTLSQKYLRRTDALRVLQPDLLERVPKWRYHFPTEAVGESKDNSGLVYRAEIYARYRLFKGRHKSDLKQGLEQLPEFLDWLQSRDIKRP
jgi:hypothetical protein